MKHTYNCAFMVQLFRPNYVIVHTTLFTPYSVQCEVPKWLKQSVHFCSRKECKGENSSPPPPEDLQLQRKQVWSAC